MTGVFALFLLELGLEQSADRLECLLLIRTVCNDLQRAVVGRSQRENPHYGLAIDLLPVFLQKDIGGESIRRLHEQRGRAGVDSGPVLNCNDFFNHGNRKRPALEIQVSLKNIALALSVSSQRMTFLENSFAE